MRRKAKKGREPERELDDVERAERKLHIHASVLDATTLTGAVAGAAIGAIAGPAGIVAGGIVGTALGVIAGVGLDKAEHARDQHEKNLDDAIGVTKGDLGAPPPEKGAHSAASARTLPSSSAPREGPR
jgi:hypothetical protein